MIFYTFKFSKKYAEFFLIFIFVVAWAMLKTSTLKDIETFSKTKPIYEGRGDKKIIAFTCNVAWGNEFLPPLLRVFEEKNVKITFFIEGRWAEKNPELLRLIDGKGHEIGNHGYSHAHHAKLSLEQNINEIKDAESIIEKITGKKPLLFAPPYGEFSDLTIKAAESLNYRVIMWSIDTIDWKKPGVDYIVNKVLKKAGNGKIVLMHPTEDTVKAMPVIIENLQKQGYKITTITDLLSGE
ncbi:MAG TPA: polysaccharide deacetylase family protein [Thermoanaerobacterales bacterium]|nr:polysaccharide deacetylase family protein [Thermoanaerobacterales bacterium]